MGLKRKKYTQKNNPIFFSNFKIVMYFNLVIAQETRTKNFKNCAALLSNQFDIRTINEEFKIFFQK